MDTAMDIDLMQSNKICRTCRTNIIPGHLPFKNCTICRGKNRVKEARRAERRREENGYIETHKKLLMESVSMEDDSGPRFPTRVNAISSGSKLSTSSSAGTLKPNVQPRFIYELGEKEKNHAIKEMKTSLQKKIRDSGGLKSIVGQVAKDRVSGNAREFLTASLLYEKLKSRALRSSNAGKRLSFHGCHSIVAVPAITHEDRIAIVVNDLRKIARISFARCSDIEKTIDDSICSMVYDCKCPSAATGNLTGPSNQAPGPKSIVECNGIVQVTAELDDSHLHGLEGQKITVHIHH